MYPIVTVPLRFPIYFNSEGVDTSQTDIFLTIWKLQGTPVHSLEQAATHVSTWVTIPSAIMGHDGLQLRYMESSQFYFLIELLPSSHCKSLNTALLSLYCKCSMDIIDLMKCQVLMNSKLIFFGQTRLFSKLPQLLSLFLVDQMFKFTKLN